MSRLAAPPPPRTRATPRSSGDPRAHHAHEIVTRRRFDPFFYNTLITRYSKLNNNNHHHLSSYSLRVFSQIHNPTVASWTALIAAHSDSLLGLRHFLSMLRHPTPPNHRTLASVFRTSASLSSLPFGLSLHALSLKLSLSSDPYPGSAIVSFYSKLRRPSDARKAFGEIPDPDSVCFSAVVVGLAQNSLPVEALSAFSAMVGAGLRSTEFSVSAALRAAAELAAAERCRVVHCHAAVTGLGRDTAVVGALIDSYGRAGMASDARRVFDESSDNAMNDVGFNAMMSAYAQQGDSDSTVEVFRAMERRGLAPDGYSFLAILSSFVGSGDWEAVEKWLSRMEADYGVGPGMEHYTCLVDGLARAGRLAEAESVIGRMPFVPDAAVWRAVLSRRGGGDADMARRVLEINPGDDSAYVIAANAFAGAGRWDDAAGIRAEMRDRGVRKRAGKSWIEVRGQFHSFSAGDRGHASAAEIYRKVEELRREIEGLGYEPVWEEALLRGAGDEEKREALWGHSEKLALAFAVLCGVPPGKAVRIVKNLRICRDCHKAFELLSLVLEREILVRDVNRYHRFLNGTCTCKGVW